MIKLVNVNKFFGNLHVLKDVNLEVAEGEKLVIIGPSGSGKSTTVRCMNFLEEPTSGEVYINGIRLNHKNKIEIARTTTAMVFQQFNLYPHKTVLQNLTLAPIKLQKVPKAEAEDLAYKYLDIVGLREKAHVYPSTLSGGQQQRVAIARALVNRPKILLADEPTGNLDANNAWEIMKLLEEINERGTTVIVVTHNMEIVKVMGKRVITIKKGVIISDVDGENDED